MAGRYFKNVKNVESPKWLQDRLTAIGLRPISALVDITNYITFDLGRPLHVYDADKISGNLTMRLANKNEECLALNEVNYKCDSDMIVISDDEKKLHGIGGVMGGFDSGCSMETKNVFLEVALFDPISVTKTGRKLNLQSDARYRFERGIDTDSIYWGVDAATQMILELCGGEVSEFVSSEINIEKRKPFMFDTNKVKTFGGIEINIEEQEKILVSLGFSINEKKSKFEIQCPTFRPDIVGEADIVEEIIRIYGYNKIPLKKAINQWANVGALVSGLYQEDYDLISRSLVDEIVEPARAMLIPGFDQLKEKAKHAGALGCGISGSGPSVFALSRGMTTAQKVAQSMAEVYDAIGVPYEVHVCPINPNGVQFLEPNNA